MRLPERLKTLWPHGLMPRAGDAGAAATAGTPADAASADDTTAVGTPADDPSAGRTSARRAEGTTSAGDTSPDERPVAGKALAETLMLGEPSGAVSKRGFDVLTAWLTGFAAELNLTRSRMTIVISSGVETAHLEVCLCDDIILALLVLHGAGFEDFAGFELLRRLRPQDLAQVTEELCSLLEEDCVLSLTYLDEAKTAGMEFLHRVDGTWARPTLEREGATITVGAEHDMGNSAVRTLLAATITRLWTTSTQRHAADGGQPQADGQRHAADGRQPGADGQP